MDDAASEHDLPEGARAALEERYGDTDWQLLHAWIDDDSILAVAAIAPAAAFDESADAFDVDIVELHMLRIFDDLQGGWDVVADHELALASLFEEFVQAYFDRTEPPS